MSSISETSVWLKFFTEAGIPPSDATTYAITFTDNRIKQEMILDLNKEYLQDMGITVMGDVIAILKHAKVHCAQKSRQKVMQSSSTTATENEKPTAPVTKKISPASRMLEHYVRKEPIPPRPSTPPLRSKRPLDDEDSVSNKRNSVFNRLGDNSVSSTTSDNPKITITMHGRELYRPTGSEISKKSPLYQRIRRDDHLNGGSEDQEYQPGVDKQLEYQGILKYSNKDAFERSVPAKKNIATMRADTTSGVKSRLGFKSLSASDSTTSAGIFAKEMDIVPKAKTPSGVLARSSVMKSGIKSGTLSSGMKSRTLSSIMKSGMKSGTMPLKITASTTKNTGSMERTVRVVPATSSSPPTAKRERPNEIKSKIRAMENHGESRIAFGSKSRALEILGEGRSSGSKSRALEVLGGGRSSSSKSRSFQMMGDGRSSKSGVFGRLSLGE